MREVGRSDVVDLNSFPCWKPSYPRLFVGG